MRRHWQLVFCAFSFCWWAYGRLPTDELAETENPTIPSESAGRGKKAARRFLAGSTEGGEGMVGAMDHAEAILEGILREAPPPELKALLERVLTGRGLYLYAR
jgi:hypothetical protein